MKKSIKQELKENYEKGRVIVAGVEEMTRFIKRLMARRGRKSAGVRFCRDVSYCMRCKPSYKVGEKICDNTCGCHTNQINPPSKPIK